MSLKNLEKKFESLLFMSRWLLAPFYLGLMLGVVLLLFKFFKELFTTFSTVLTMNGNEIVLSILTLVDISLIANLLIIIIFSGYESFVSKIDVDDHEDKPGWMGKVGFAALKIKVIGSIVAISAIELLKIFVNTSDYDPENIKWKIIIHITFVVSGVLFAVMDRTTKK
ncbi:MAG: TIGR00645 family protein [Lentisphaeraceae bacterium]|nr:TIGR00645 family protein [Lentisphaeraceae bacterium]